VADTDNGAGHQVWASPKTLAGSFPDTEGEANLAWAAGDRLVFVNEIDNWPHLYSIPAAGGEPLLLTPGAFMVEHVVESRDKRTMIYDANTGATPGDDDRRHVFTVPVDRAAPVELTRGPGLEWKPNTAGDGSVVFVSAGAGDPPSVGVVGLDGKGRRAVTSQELAADFPAGKFVTPREVSWTAPDGLVVHGQLFQTPGAAAKPGVIFVHGGPPRQMLLGWHYMDYYSNAYAVNQYLAAHGFVVLSVNYRLGIGYGIRRTPARPARPSIMTSLPGRNTCRR
jgi:hypothetical protein